MYYRQYVWRFRYFLRLCEPRLIISGSKTPYIEAFALARSPNLLAALPLAHRFGLHKKNTYWLSDLICSLILALGFKLHFGFRI